jgi:hypothetical protein
LNLERAQLAIVAALAAAAFVSIFATQLLLGVGILVLFARILGGRVRFPRTPLDGPTLAFCLWTLLSASFSTNPGHSHDSAKKLVLFLLFYLAVDTLASPNARHRVLTAALLGGLALSSLTLLQYFLLGFDTLNVRPRGFLGHYMSASGLTMGVVILSAARLAFARTGLGVRPRDGRLLAGLLGALVLVGAAQTAERPAAAVTGLFVLGLAITGGALALAEPRWTDASTGTLLAALALPLGSLALLVSQTRNAWLGAVAGLATVAVLRAPRTLWLLAAAMLAVLAVRPAAVMNRLTLEDASSRDRYYMWQAGIDMILDKPVFGQGPGMIPRAPHLHDNALQIAAERGLPCLVFWLWWMAAAMADAWREARRGAPAAVAALAALVAIMVAGLFEYNFGDSEVLMFVLLVASLPYALRRERTLASGAPA